MSVIAGKYPSTPWPGPDGGLLGGPLGRGTAAVRVIRADPADAQDLSLVIAAAFVDLAPSVWLISDQATRREVFPDYFRLYVDEAFATGTVYTTPDRTAAALWITKPGKAESAQEPGREGEIGLAAATAPYPGHDQASDYDERLAAVAGPFADRFREFDAILERNHPSGVAHDHLAILAVHPSVQHRGIGSALLAEHHRVLDAGQTAAYLEASDAGTRAIYLDHGYKDLGSPIHLSPEGPLMYPMVRRPVARVQ